MTDMARARGSKDVRRARPRAPIRVRLPGFLSDHEIGLGDAIKRATSSLGIRPCGGCARRAAALNGWMVFTRRHQK
jgi:hypothetical protein